MADQVDGDRRGARYSALLLVVTGIALVGCVALAVGVTIRLVDLPRPRVTADLSLTTGPAPEGPAPDGTVPAGDPSSLATSTSDLAAEDAAKLAAQRVARQQASRSKVRHYTPPPDPTPSPTPTAPSTGQPDPQRPDFPHYQPHGGYFPRP